MVSISHIHISSRNLYESADRIRRETGIGFYDGGWFKMGLANKIFPLGGGAYLELVGIVDPSPPPEVLSHMRNVIATGDHFVGVHLRVDTLEELQALSKRYKSKISDVTDGERIRSSGPRLEFYSTPGAEALLKGLPCFCFFADMTIHPSGESPQPAPGLVDPQGISFLEWGGTEAEMTEWLGFPASTLPFQFNGKPMGLHACGVRTGTGEIVITRKPFYED